MMRAPEDPVESVNRSKEILGPGFVEVVSV